MNSIAAVFPWTKQDISMHQGSGLFEIFFIFFLAFMFYYIAREEGDVLIKLVLLQFSWRRGFKDSRGQGFKCLFYRDFIRRLMNPFTVLFVVHLQLEFTSKLCKSILRPPLSRTFCYHGCNNGRKHFYILLIGY